MFKKIAEWFNTKILGAAPPAPPVVDTPAPAPTETAGDKKAPKTKNAKKATTTRLEKAPKAPKVIKATASVPAEPKKAAKPRTKKTAAATGTP